MIKNILIYLAVLVSAVVFNIFYYKWFSWVLLAVIAALPVVSLLVSLPFMLITSVSGIKTFTQDKITAGSSITIGIVSKHGRRIFCPRIKIKIKAQNSFSGLKTNKILWYGGLLGKPYNFFDKKLAAHCGELRLNVMSCVVYDFLGLFAFPVRGRRELCVLVMPKKKQPEKLINADQLAVIGYKPKRGGGFSDYYELRQYQNGDSVKNIHWKISSKYDDLIVREPSEPRFREFAIRAELTDNPAANDDILARLSFVCYELNSSGVGFVCQNAFGGEYCVVENEAQLEQFLLSVFRKTTYQNTVTFNTAPIVYSIRSNGEEVVQ